MWHRGGFDGRGMVAVEVIPGPAEKCIGLAVCSAQEHGVHAQPGSEGDWALDLMPVLSDFCNGGIATDHRHHALVLVRERLRWLASTLTQDVLGRPAARLLRHRPELGQGRPTLIIGGDVRDVTDRVYPREALHCQIGEDIQTAATAGN